MRNVTSVRLDSGRGENTWKVCGEGGKKEGTKRLFLRPRTSSGERHTREQDELLELFRARLCTLDDSYFNFLFAN